MKQKALFSVLLMTVIFSTTTLVSAQKDSIANDLKFDLGFTRDKNINIWPLFKRVRTKELKETQFLFSWIKFRQDLTTGEKHSHIFPLYWADKSENKKDIRILSTYYPSLIRIKKENSDTGMRSFSMLEAAPNISMLKLSKSKDGLQVDNNLFFFLWYKNDVRLQISHLVVFPLYWQYKSPERESKTFFPLFTQGTFNHKKGKFVGITPLFWQVKKENSLSRTILPLWRYKTQTLSTGDTMTTSTVFPLYWARKSKEKDSKVFFPIVWKYKNKKYSSLTIAPFFSYGKNPMGEKNHLAITPLYIHTKYYDETSNFILPIFLNSTVHRTDDTIKTNIIFPLFWSKKSKNKSRTVLFPLLWRKTQISETDTLKKTTIFPLYWAKTINDKSHNILFPLIWKFKSPSYSSLAFFPFFALGNSPDKKNKHFAVTPFFWKITNERNKLTTFFPLIWHIENKNSYETTTKNILFPVYWNKKTITLQDTTTKNVLFPIYWHTKNNKKNNTVVFPFVWKYNSPHFKSLTIFPLYSKGKAADSSLHFYGISPLFWHIKDRNKTTNFLIPIVWNKTTIDSYNKDTSKINIIFPLYWSKKKYNKNTKVLFPILWSFNGNKYKSLSIVPFYSKTESKYDSTKKVTAITPFFWHKTTPKKDNITIFPIYWYRKHTNYMGINPTITHTVFPIYWSKKNESENNRTLFPFYWKREKYSQTDTSNRSVIFPFVWSKKGKYYNSLTVFPLFSFGKSPDKTKKHVIVTPLFYHFQSPKKRTNTLFPLYWNKTEITETDSSYSSIIFPLFWQKKKQGNGISDKYSLFFPLYWAHKSNKRNDKIIFPVVYNFKSKDYKSLTLFPLFSRGISTDKQNKYIGITPLIWHFKNPERTRTTIFPIFGQYSDSTNLNKFHLLYVLMRYKAQNDHKHLSFIYPICAYEQKQDYKYFRFAPIFWYQKSPELSYFSVQPIYYGSKTPEWKKQFILWFLYSEKQEIGIKKQHNFLWKFAEWSKYNNGDFEYRLAYLLLANSKKNGVREKSIFPLFYKRTEPNGNIETSAFLHFYSRFKRKLPDSNEFYQEEKILWFIRLRSNYSKLKAEGKIK